VAALPALANKDSSALLLLHNFHRFLNNPEVIQTTFHQLIAGKQQGTFLIVLAPVVQIPVKLEKLFVVIEHTLPDRRERSTNAVLFCGRLLDPKGLASADTSAVSLVGRWDYCSP
jgi:hypothetical protein